MAEIRGEIRDFRQATTSTFNAMRADFTDLRRELTEFQQRVDNGFAEMRGKFDATAAGQQHIVDLVTTIMNQRAATPRLPGWGWTSWRTSVGTRCAGGTPGTGSTPRS
jgi:hypothetical protein